jgi:predicted esterase
MRTGFAVVMLMFLLGAAPATQPLPPTAVPRRDFLAAFSRLDAAYAARRIGDPEARASLHRAVDQAVEQHLTVRTRQAVQTLNELADSLEPAPVSPAEKLARSLHVSLTPPVAWQNRPSVMRVRVARMYRVDASLPVEFRLVIRSEQDQRQTILDVRMRIADDSPFTLTRATPRADPGRYRIELIAPDGARHFAGHWTVAASSLTALAQVNDRRIASIIPGSREIYHAITTCMGRNGILTDDPNYDSALHPLIDPIELSRQVGPELESIRNGVNPYTGREGDWWNSVMVGGRGVWTRMYVPAQVKQRQPMPLVIALQRIGPEDWDIIDSANGRIRELADKHGFIVAAPRASLLTRYPLAFVNIVEAISAIYPIDASRVYIIGHSHGAPVAVEMGSQNPDKIAGMVLIAGSNLGNVKKLPRTLVYSGGIDRFFPADGAREMVAKARNAGIRVEHRTNPTSGHVLLVDDVMDEAVEWLLKPAD